VRFLIDENLSLAVKDWFESKGFDVIHARELAPGASDSEWISRSAAEARIVVTLDKDFGELAFSGERQPRGVILLRLKPLEMSHVLRRLDEVWPSIADDLDNNFIVIGNHTVRTRTLPTT
jgi:predicted nuclease of predicted toxin-antitoxin system